MAGLFEAELLTANEAANVLRQAADLGDIPATYAQAVLVLLDDRDYLRQVASAAVDARQAQRVYFRDRTQTNLQAAKDLERKLDQLLKE